MPRTSRWIAAALSLAVIASLSACLTAPEPPPRTSSAAPTPTSVFASDAEALAAAIDAYEAYISTSSAITAKGGANADRIRDVSVSSYGDVLVESLENFAKSGLRTSGSSTFDHVQLADVYQEANGARVVVHLCSDVSGVRLLDADGLDVTPPARPNRTSLELHFESTPDDPRTLLIESSEVWSGDSFC